MSVIYLGKLPEHECELARVNMSEEFELLAAKMTMFSSTWELD